MRTHMVIGNWKMNGTVAEARSLATSVRDGLKRPGRVEVVVCPPFTALAAVAEVLAGTPIALGSYWGYAGLAVMAPFIIWRLLDEERLLASELPGYAEYRARVRHRLVPGVW